MTRGKELNHPKRYADVVWRLDDAFFGNNYVFNATLFEQVLVYSIHCFNS